MRETPESRRVRVSRETATPRTVSAAMDPLDCSISILSMFTPSNDRAERMVREAKWFRYFRTQRLTAEAEVSASEKSGESSLTDVDDCVRAEGVSVEDVVRGPRSEPDRPLHASRRRQSCK